MKEIQNDVLISIELNWDNWLCGGGWRKWGEKLHSNKSRSHVVIYYEEEETYLDAYTF